VRFKLLYIFALSIIFTDLSIHAQIRFCGSDNLLQEKHNNSIQSRMQHELLEKVLYEKALSSDQVPGQNQRLKYQLPLVLHVISPPGSSVGSKFNPDNSVILRGMEMLNDIFSNSGDFNVPNGIDSEIAFCLAQKRPDGSAFNGINRIESQLVNGNLCNEPSTSILDDAAIKNLGSWDCCTYINVYLVTKLNDGFGCGLLGYATFPGLNCDAIDGIVVESATWSDPYAMKIMAHEVGHFLGLYHTFQGACRNDDCLTDGDRVCDTPPDAGRFTNCPDNTCTTDANAGFPNPFTSDVDDPTENFMDYSLCFERFSPGQISRMHSVIEMFRSCLSESTACEAPFELDASVESLLVPNLCNLSACPEIKVRNTGQTAIQQLSLRIRIGTQIFTPTVNINIPPLGTATLTLECRTAQAGSVEISVEILEVNNQQDQNPDNNIITIFQNFIEPISIPQLTIEASACGFNGNIYVFYSQTSPVEIILVNSDGDSIGTGNAFNELTPGTYQIVIRSLIYPECFRTFSAIVPDDCPPCISGIINSYAAVTAINCNGNIEVQSTTGFKPGDQVLLIQMKGAIVSELNNANAGSITDIGVAGNYEINIIERIEGNTIWFKYLLDRDYDVQERVQVVSIPEYENLVACNLTAKAWDGSTGGILILDVKGKLEIVGNIDVSFKGFRAGNVSQNFYNGSCDFPQYFINQNGYGQKGEGVTTAFENMNFGMGRNGSGGGGGNPVNSGGGGGSNAGFGGDGGYQWDICLLSSGGQQNGLGGTALSSFIAGDKLFLGGGGGGGHQNDTRGTSGGNGGGMIIIKANTIEISNAVIKSDGASVPSLFGDKTHDGQGGGGAGGTIILDAKNLIGSLSVSARGGTGANPTDPDVTSRHGPGGGGGGGFLGFTNLIVSSDLRPGMSGINSNNMSFHGATNGQEGIVNANISLNYSSEVWLPEFSIERSADCTGNTARVCFGDDPVDFQVNDQTITTGLCTEYLNSGTYVVKIILAPGCEIDTVFFIELIDAFDFELIETQSAICEQNGEIVIVGKGGTPPYTYSLNGGPQLSAGIFKNLSPGNYQVQLTDSDGCVIEVDVSINQLTPQTPDILLDSIEHVTCDGDSGLMIFSLNTVNIQPDFELVGSGDTLRNDFGIFENLQPGLYTLFFKDQYGCVYEFGPYEILNLAEPTTREVNDTICPGAIYTLIDGTQINAAGEYIIRIPQVVGCDSIYHYTIDTFAVSSTYLSDSICEGDFIIFGQDTLTEPGSYVFIDLDENGCERSNYLDLILVDTSIVFLQFDICENDTISVANKQFTEAGSYTEVLQNQNSCDSTIHFVIRDLEPYFCVPCLVFIPDAFSPNGDGINDVFRLYPNYVNFYLLQIYNRWGGLVYESTDPDPFWDGKFKGRQVEIGVYIYIVKGLCLNGMPYESSGDVTLFR
jgi:gliding motility-associated-like protein